ncbi:DUF6173 family protein [Mesobacterium sp. TK19101]|uniref:DUF6173 family protein n=1 Tax=Mesobacterium hydrothermale TaxID=3111907 RepID=A0ABU6HK59_9RHOB|nr:DUF6173 family protein [Mesobacterium sp. TK19101]MEC3862721.1 DUF6173 family protein [Mesobacterium sp. TK19101]
MDDRIATTAEAHEADALPRKRDVHTGGEVQDERLPDAVTRTPVEDKSAAEWAYERLILYIQNFEEQLDNEHEVAMGFAGGEAGVLRIEGLGFFDPDIVTFYGTDETGMRTQLIQHVTQLSVFLRAMPKQVEKATPRRIGFRLGSGLEQS